MSEFGWLSVVSALATITVAVAFRKVATALFCGIVAGALIVAQYDVGAWILLILHYLFHAFTDLERLKIVLFLLLIGALLNMIAESGGYVKFSEVLSNPINSPRKSRLTTWFLSLSLFFDDYANVLISGASMRSINEKHQVSRAFLAYLVDVVAVMASIMLISTWAAFEGAIMVDAGSSIGLHKSMSSFFLQAFPYHFYTFFAIFLTFLVAYTGKWFGYKADTQTFNDDTQPLMHRSHITFQHVIMPFVTLIGCAFLGLFVLGSYFAHQHGDALTLLNILGNAPSIEILIGATTIALIEIIVWMKKDQVLSRKMMLKTSWTGMKEMGGVCMVIIMATGLSAVSDDLHTGEFIAQSITGYLTPQMLPVLIFVISMLITVATSFSWSSMAIVMPIAYQLAVAKDVPEFIPILSAAVITGAVSGEHMIPYSEKAVMTSAACKITPIYHLKTQIFQTLLAFSAGALGFTLIGLKVNFLLCLFMPMTLITCIHVLFAKENSAY